MTATANDCNDPLMIIDTHSVDIDKHGGGGGSNVEDSDTDEKSSGARTLGAKQGRRGTFRVFGSLLDSKRGRFGGSGKQQQPYESGQGQQQQGKDGHVTNNFR